MSTNSLKCKRALDSMKFRVYEDVWLQSPSPMQSCRSLHSLSLSHTLSANVLKEVQQPLILCRKLNKLTEENQQELIFSQINIENNPFGSP